MRALILSKWTSSLNNYLSNRTIIESQYSVISHYLRFTNFHDRPAKFLHDSKNNERFIICNVSTRNFTTNNTLCKSKDKEKKKKSVKPQQINEHELSEVINVENLTSNLVKSVEDLKSNYVKHLTLRSSTGSIEQVPVSFDGQEYLLQELVQIIRKPKTVVLDVTTFPQAIPQVLDALNKSGMNLNPQQDGTTIFIPIPKVTKEHRENLAKNAKVLYLKCRDTIKDIRNKEIKNLKKKPSLSEDDGRRIQSQIEALGDRYIKDAENILATKQKELLGSSD